MKFILRKVEKRAFDKALNEVFFDNGLNYPQSVEYSQNAEGAIVVEVNDTSMWRLEQLSPISVKYLKDMV